MCLIVLCMRGLRAWLLGTCLLWMGALPVNSFAQAVVTAQVNVPDLSKIDRIILKEPIYHSPAPKYVLLLFGPQAKRVWVVIDGDTVYIDRNSDGDLTSNKKRFDKAADGRLLCIEIPDDDGKISYVISNVEQYASDVPAAGRAYIGVMIFGPVQYKQYSVVDLADSPRMAELAHFNGPLTIGPATVEGKPDSSLKLQTGPQEAELRAMVGTWTRYGRPVVVVSEEVGHDQFRGYLPMVNVEFPAKVAGELPVYQRYLLDETCCASIFKGKVHAPPEAGTGTAKVTFSFDMWKEGHVAHSTAEIPVIVAEQAKDER